MSNHIDFGRLSYLGDKLKAGLASKQEKDEYMMILYSHGSITEKQYNDYLANRNKTKTDEILNAALGVGAVILIGYIISEMFKQK
jgi:hypothetical protein